MKIFLISLVLIITVSSCKNDENENKIKNYENTIKEILIKDMKRTQTSIEFEMERLENGNEDIPVKYKSLFNTMNHLNHLCLKFYTSSINSKDFDKINESLKKIKNTIVNLDIHCNHKPNLEKITEIKNEIDKYLINKELKVLVLYLLKNDGSASYAIGPCAGPSPASVVPERLNDSTVVIYINKSDRPNSLKIREVKDFKTKKDIPFYQKRRNLQSYTIKTKSDSLKFKASLIEKGNYPRLSKLDTIIVVNERYYFNKFSF